MMCQNTIPAPTLSPLPYGSVANCYMYALPENQQQAELRSRVNRKGLRYFRKILRALFQKGRRQNGFYCIGSIAIALENAYHAPSGRFFQPGQWLDEYSGRSGYDVIGLVAYLWGQSYDAAVQMVAYHLDLVSTDAFSPNKERTLEWVQERHPLRPYFLQATSGGDPEFSVYSNEVGTPIAVVRNAYDRDGNSFPVFWIIMKQKRTGHCVTVEAFPDRPYHPYNLHKIARSPEAVVAIVQNEASADSCKKEGMVFSAIPGGLDNILDADFSCLVGRVVYVCLRIQDVCRGRLIARKLEGAGVAESYFWIDGKGAHPFRNLEKIAHSLGIELQTEDEDREYSGTLIALDLASFLSVPLKDLEWVLEGLIPLQGLAMVHAPRGVGKTHFGLGVAYACASGTAFLKWQAPKPRGVLYLDGEMSAIDMQARLRSISTDENENAQKNLRILTPDQLSGPVPDLATEEGQNAIEPLLEGVSLVIIDNLATLCRSGNESGGDSWVDIQRWLLDLRRRGKSVLLVHHSGKSGGQRGTSRLEDVLDTVIRLQRPADYTPSEGARFEVHLTKARHTFGDAAQPFEVTLTSKDDKSVWTMREIVDGQLEEACALFDQGKSVREVGEELGISKSTAGRLHLRLKEEGWLRPDTEEKNG